MKLNLKDIRFDAVIVGALVDNIGTLFAMMLLMTALTSAGIAESDALERMKSLSGLLLTLIIGLGWTMMGGYAAARMAKRNEVLHGALVAVVGMVLALVFRESDIPAWYDIAGLVAMLPVGILGGFRAKQRNLRTK